MDTGHARFAPSSLHRIMRCAGGVALCEQVPEEDSSASREGTAAHYVLERLLRDGERIPVDALAPNGELVTQEMVEGADLAAGYIAEHATGPLHIEEQLSTGLHCDCWGTPDVWFSGDESLHVFDYKFGHRLVEPEENYQLIAYACGARRKETRIILHIIQPRWYHRGGPLRSWALTAEQLAEYGNRIRDRLALIDESSPLSVTPEGCRDCRARHICPALQEAAGGILDLTREAEPLDLDAHAIGLELTLLQQAEDLLKARISGLSTQAEAMIRSGKPVPGFAVVSNPGRERWKVPVKEVKALGQLWGTPLVEEKPITPNQARKILPNPQVLSGLTERPAGSKLEKVDLAETSRIFGVDDSAT